MRLLRKIVLLIGFCILLNPNVCSQVKLFHHSDGGVITPFVLSFIDFNSNPSNLKNIPRFSCFFHLGHYYDLNIGNHIGFYSGVTLLNIGFTAENKATDVEKRFRTYAFGVPVAIKLGSFKDDFYIYGGGELQWFFHYKEKTYINNDKIKNSEWFSNKTPTIMPSIFVGIQFPKDWTIRFQYQLNNFLRTENVDNSIYNAQFGSIPNGRLFWISISKTNFEKYFKKKKQSQTQNALYTLN